MGRGGPAGSLDIALVHVAIHDAVQAIEGRFQPYYYSDQTKLGVGSPEAAAAAAAHRVLVLLYPTQQGRLDDYYDDYLLDNGLKDDPGLEVGEAAAVALHTNHYRPVIPLLSFFGGTNPGEWRSAVPMAFHYLGVSTPFTLNRISQFRPPPPPPMQSAYFREYEEVKTLGRDTAHPQYADRSRSLLVRELLRAVERGPASNHQRKAIERRRQRTTVRAGQPHGGRHGNGRLGVQALL